MKSKRFTEWCVLLLYAGGILQATTGQIILCIRLFCHMEDYFWVNAISMVATGVFSVMWARVVQWAFIDNPYSKTDK